MKGSEASWAKLKPLMNPFIVNRQKTSNRPYPLHTEKASPNMTTSNIPHSAPVSRLFYKTRTLHLAIFQFLSIITYRC